MRLEMAIGWRYLRSPRSEGAISFITLVALLGVMLGVAALVVALAVMNGYQANLVRAMAGSMPHVSIHPLGATGFGDTKALEEALVERFGPVALAPFALQETLVRSPGGAAGTIQGVMLRGIDPVLESQVPNFLALVDEGTPDWAELTPGQRIARAKAVLRNMAEAPADGPAPVLLSRSLARKLGVKPGAELIPMTFPKPGSGFSPLPVAKRMVVRAYFKTGIPVFDELVLVLPLGFLPALLPGKEVEISIGMRLADPMGAGAAAELLRKEEKSFAQPFYVYSWLESNGALFEVIEFQKRTLFVALMLIVVIAFFGMVSALSMLVVEKRREIAILKALGLRRRGITGLFAVQGVLVGSVGTGLGVALGLAVCAVLDHFPLVEIPPGVYPGTDRIPVLVSPADVALVVVCSLAVCCVAVLFPAWKAGALAPVDGLRGA
ncbi:MAG: ABC transporter permease [bacterium]